MTSHLIKCEGTDAFNTWILEPLRSRAKITRLLYCAPPIWLFCVAFSTFMVLLISVKREP